MAAVFAWQPQRIAQTFTFLANRRIFGCRPRAKLAVWPISPERVMTATRSLAASPLVPGLVLAVLVPCAVAWHLRINDTDYWWYVSRAYYWLAWLPLCLLAWYAFGICVLRAVIAASAVSFNLLSCNVRVDPYHDDELGGLAPVWRLLVLHGGPAVVAVAVALVMSLQPLVGGERPLLDVATVSLGAVYVVAIPVFFIVPLFAAHLKMQRARAQELSRIRRGLQRVEKGNQRRPTTAGHSRYLYLVQRYEYTLRHFPTWPVPRMLGSILAALYFAGALASLITVFR